MARVRFVGVSAQVRLKCESANFLVTYTKKDTRGELQGDEGRELSARNYGPGEWWLLLDEQYSSILLPRRVMCGVVRGRDRDVYFNWGMPSRLRRALFLEM